MKTFNFIVSNLLKNSLVLKNGHFSGEVAYFDRYTTNSMEKQNLLVLSVLELERSYLF